MKEENPRLKPIKGGDIFWRGLYGTTFDKARYVIEVDYFDPRENVRLYRDGELIDMKQSPARFDIGQAVIYGSMALYGMKRACLVTKEGGISRRLEPLEGTAEDRRMRFARKHSATSNALATIAWLVLAIALITQVPNALNFVGQWLGFSVPTFDLPTWLDAALAILGIFAGLDRGLRMKHVPLLDD